MAASVLVDAGFLVALLSRRDGHHPWAKAQALRHPLPWLTCDAALSEAFHLVGRHGLRPLGEMLRRRSLVSRFDLSEDFESVLRLMDKYADLPMSLADACLVRMTERLPGPLVLTTDSDFRVYRRNDRQVVPFESP